MTSEEISAAIRSADLARVADALDGLVEDTICVTTGRVEEQQLALGESKIGGSPDLPPDFAWPEWRGAPQAFIAQINCAEAYDFDSQGVLPRTGMLYFFYDRFQESWGYEASERDSWKVTYFHGDPSVLVRTERPPDPPQPEPAKPGFWGRIVHKVLGPTDTILPDAIFPACRVTFSVAATLPSCDSVVIDWLEMTEQETKAYSDLLESFVATPHRGDHRLLGRPRAIQSAVLGECALISRGVGPDAPRDLVAREAASIKEDGIDWRLLLQVDCDDNAEMMWGDTGMLYFCIREADLAHRRFDDVWMMSQCY